MRWQVSFRGSVGDFAVALQRWQQRLDSMLPKKAAAQEQRALDYAFPVLSTTTMLSDGRKRSALANAIRAAASA